MKEIIKLAQELADSIAGTEPADKSPNKKLWYDRWNKSFHYACDLLAHNEGIRTTSSVTVEPEPGSIEAAVRKELNYDL